MPIATMLTALEDVRRDGKLDDLSDLIMPAPPDQRLMAALLIVGGHFGIGWRAAVDTLDAGCIAARVAKPTTGT
jgi:hypothetical protein